MLSFSSVVACSRGATPRPRHASSTEQQKAKTISRRPKIAQRGNFSEARTDTSTGKPDSRITDIVLNLAQQHRAVTSARLQWEQDARTVRRDVAAGLALRYEEVLAKQRNIQAKLEIPVAAVRGMLANSGRGCKPVGEHGSTSEQQSGVKRRSEGKTRNPKKEQIQRALPCYVEGIPVVEESAITPERLVPTRKLVDSGLQKCLCCHVKRLTCSRSKVPDGADTATVQSEPCARCIRNGDTCLVSEQNIDTWRLVNEQGNWSASHGMMAMPTMPGLTGDDGNGCQGRNDEAVKRIVADLVRGNALCEIAADGRMVVVAKMGLAPRTMSW